MKCTTFTNFRGDTCEAKFIDRDTFEHGAKYGHVDRALGNPVAEDGRPIYTRLELNESTGATCMSYVVVA